jgi:hypothetical protein
MILATAVASAILSLAQSQSVGNGVSKSTYATSDPIPAKEFMMKYFPTCTPGDECTNDICDCPAGTGGDTEWYIQQGRVWITTYGSCSGGPSAGNGFGVHMVNLTNHKWTGGMSTEEVEGYFKEKMGDMTKFDSFMDYNTMWFTSGLSTYASTFKADGVPYLTTTWTYNSQTFTSLFVYVRDWSSAGAWQTQVVLELFNYGTLDANLTSPGQVHMPHARASPDLLDTLLAEQANRTKAGQPDTGDVIYIHRVNRAASRTAMDKLEAFYVTGLGQTMSSHTGSSSEGAETKCFRWSGATVDVCYQWRADTETAGDFKVSKFEDMLNTVHTNLLKGQPLCGVDKWFDNHYAIDSMSLSGSTFVTYVNDNPDAFYYCSSAMGPGASGYTLHYLFDPCGWGVQLDVNMNGVSAPSGCSSAAAAAASAPAFVQGTGNPACSPGTCTKF